MWGTAVISSDEFLSLMDVIDEAIVIYDRDGALVYCNRAFRELYKYSPDEAAPGVHYSELGRIDVSRGNVVVGDEFGSGAEYLKRKAEYREKLEGSFTVQLRDGRWLKTTDRRLPSGGFISIQADVTDLKKAEESLKVANESLQRANRLLQNQLKDDHLTGALTRKAIIEFCDAEMVRAERIGQPLSILILDLDNFKEINDRHGHSAGDQVLRSFVSAIKKNIRPYDKVGRLGGDELVVVLPFTSVSESIEISKRILTEVSGDQQQVGDAAVRYSCSIGACTSDALTQDRESLFRAADIALYSAKKSGRNHVQHYKKPTTTPA